MPVDQRHPHRQRAEFVGTSKATEAATDNHHMRPVSGNGVEWPVKQKMSVEPFCNFAIHSEKPTFVKCQNDQKKYQV
jgi:hypothetical protein